ncbi:MAG: Hsp20 family protein [Gammaproteobacteria bacterium]|nr:MAG: Hsp20 family protein [Gammaproteobacteria bacterium]
MNTIDLTPLYRSTIGFDRFSSLLDNALRTDQGHTGYPPYNIEVTGEDEYLISLAVAGFELNELEIQVERDVLTIKGRKAVETKGRRYLHQGIANRSFERKFNLADHVKVTGASLNNGLLNVHLAREIPESMKPRTIAINSTGPRVVDQAA